MIGCVRNPGALTWYRISRTTHAGGNVLNVSCSSQGGHVLGLNHSTCWSCFPWALIPRDRGRPLLSGVRRVPGMTKGRAGVKSTLWRAWTRSRACKPAWVSRARWAYEHNPRSATSTSPDCKAGCTSRTRAKSCVLSGATTSWGGGLCQHETEPADAQRERHNLAVVPLADRTPPAKRAYRAWSRPSHRRRRCDAHASDLPLRERAGPSVPSALRDGRGLARGVWTGPGSRLRR